MTVDEKTTSIKATIHFDCTPSIDSSTYTSMSSAVVAIRDIFGRQNELAFIHDCCVLGNSGYSITYKVYIKMENKLTRTGVSFTVKELFKKRG